MTLSSKLEFGAGVRRRSVDIDLTGVGQDGGGAQDAVYGYRGSDTF